MVVMVIDVVRINRKSREWKRSFFLGIASIDVNNGLLRFRIFEEIGKEIVFYLLEYFQIYIYSGGSIFWLIFLITELLAWRVTWYLFRS